MSSFSLPLFLYLSIFPLSLSLFVVALLSRYPRPAAVAFWFMALRAPAILIPSLINWDNCRTPQRFPPASGFPRARARAYTPSRLPRLCRLSDDINRNQSWNIRRYPCDVKLALTRVFQRHNELIKEKEKERETEGECPRMSQENSSFRYASLG